MLASGCPKMLVAYTQCTERMRPVTEEGVDIRAPRNFDYTFAYDHPC